MGKVLQFKKVTKIADKNRNTEALSEQIEDEISAVINNCSLTPSNRRWILENMLMNMDDQLEEYKKELDRAERTLNALVKSAEREIAAAYLDFDSQVRTMTRAVKKLTRGSSGPDLTGTPAAPDEADKP
ncbi:MAG TPA: hypothetical protein DCZ75_06715 [Geobacter sp.]|nr:hypothetical protein [Geobacter sp.]